MWIKTIDGQYFTGQDAREVVEAMRNAAWFKESDLQAYMHAVAERARIWNGRQLDTSSPERFLNTMQGAGLIDKGMTQ